MLFYKFINVFEPVGKKVHNFFYLSPLVQSIVVFEIFSFVVVQ